MFNIAIPHGQRPLLITTGVSVKVNGKETTLRRDGEYLTYFDDGELQRCKILAEVFESDRLRFMAASHGAENDTFFFSNAAPIEFDGIADENPEKLRHAVEQSSLFGKRA